MTDKPCSEIAKEVRNKLQSLECPGCEWHETEIIEEALQTERTAREKAEAALEAWKSMTYCAYCGFEAPLDVDASVISEHIRTCEKHPIREYENRIAALEAEVERLKTQEGGLRHKIHKYQTGDEVTALKDRVKSLEGALTRYGVHDPHNADFECGICKVLAAKPEGEGK